MKTHITYFHLLLEIVHSTALRELWFHVGPWGVVAQCRRCLDDTSLMVAIWLTAFKELSHLVFNPVRGSWVLSVSTSNAWLSYWLPFWILILNILGSEVTFIHLSIEKVRNWPTTYLVNTWRWIKNILSDVLHPLARFSALAWSETCWGTHLASLISYKRSTVICTDCPRWVVLWLLIITCVICCHCVESLVLLISGGWALIFYLKLVRHVLDRQSLVFWLIMLLG